MDVARESLIRSNEKNPMDVIVKHWRCALKWPATQPWAAIVLMYAMGKWRLAVITTLIHYIQGLAANVGLATGATACPGTAGMGLSVLFSLWSAPLPDYLHHKLTKAIFERAQCEVLHMLGSR